MQARSFFITPHRTPNAVKYLIWFTAVIAILTPILSFVFLYFFQQPGPQVWLPLSRYGLTKGWIWQLISYLFVHSTGLRVDISFFISLFFHLFLLWIAGSEICFRFGKKTFLFFYFSAALFASLLATALLFIFSSNAFIYGSAPAIFALLTVWTMLYPELELSFFFILRLKIKWLVLIYFGFVFLTQISGGNWIFLITEFAGVFFGYVVGRFFWNLSNPFPFSRFKKPRGKIIDISRFQESDEDFMERMLDKISKHGHASLTKKEREKLENISKKRKNYRS